MMKTIVILLILILTVVWYVVFYPSKPYQQVAEETSVTQTPTQQTVASAERHAWVDFSIDDFNKTITLHGLLGNQKELDDIIQNFASTQPDKSIRHDITIDERLRSTDFALNLLLLLAAITDIKAAEVNFTSQQIELSGLALNQKSKARIMLKLQQLFADEFIIIDNVELVFEETIEIDNLFSLPIIPEL